MTVMEAVACLKFFLVLERVEQAVGGVEHPDCEGHGGRRTGGKRYVH